MNEVTNNSQLAISIPQRWTPTSNNNRLAIKHGYTNLDEFWRDLSLVTLTEGSSLILSTDQRQIPNERPTTTPNLSHSASLTQQYLCNIYPFSRGKISYPSIL